MKINDEEYIEVVVPEVSGASNASEAFSMILAEKGATDNYLPILIGLNEARAIIAEIHNSLPFRPLTHTLLPDLLFKIITDYAIEFVSIDSYDSGIYYASVVIKSPDNTFSKLDARPSDAVAIALHSVVPIYFNKRLWEEQSFSNGLGKKTWLNPLVNPYKDPDFLKTLTIGELRELLEVDIENELYEHAAIIQKIINEKEEEGKVS